MSSHGPEALKRIAASGAMETAGWLALTVQLALGAAILAATWRLPKELLVGMAVGSLILAYATAPRKQAQALRERGLSNSITLTTLYEGARLISHSEHPNPWPYILTDTGRAWTAGYFSNPLNYGAGALALATEGRAFWANLTAQTVVGWGLTMFWSSVIISEKDQEVLARLPKLDLTKIPIINRIKLAHATHTRI